VLLLFGVLKGSEALDRNEAACLLDCEVAREQCRGSSLLVEPPTPASRRFDSEVCLPEHLTCDAECR